MTKKTASPLLIGDINDQRLVEREELKKFAARLLRQMIIPLRFYAHIKNCAYKK